MQCQLFVNKDNNVNHFLNFPNVTDIFQTQFDTEFTVGQKGAHNLKKLHYLYENGCLIYRRENRKDLLRLV